MMREEEARLEVWTNRRNQIRATLKSAESTKNDRISKGYYDKDGDGNDNDNNKTALALTAFVVGFGAVILRVGGRAALMSTLGLDFATDNPELQTQLDGVLQYTANLDVSLLALFFTLAWTFVKVFCFDAGGIVLALASGILFGGVLQGALMSATAATIASTVAFGLAKIDSPVRKKALEILEEYPSLRGIEKVVAKDGVKAILTLRMAPVLPIPIGLYNYVYGVTNVPLADFMAGIFFGSFKPYLLDSYLGMFGKNLVDGTKTSDTEDAILLVVLGVSVLIGVFASQLAGETWEAVQKEVELEQQQQQSSSDNNNNNMDELENVQTSFLGMDLPQWAVDFQKSLKRSEQKMEQTIQKEYMAQVWNYTKDETIPAHLDPARAFDSPEVLGKYKGFDVLDAVCDGIVLTPVLFKTFTKYSDPGLDEKEERQQYTAVVEEKEQVDTSNLLWNEEDERQLATLTNPPQTTTVMEEEEDTTVSFTLEELDEAVAAVVGSSSSSSSTSMDTNNDNKNTKNNVPINTTTLTKKRSLNPLARWKQEKQRIIASLTDDKLPSYTDDDDDDDDVVVVLQTKDAVEETTIIPEELNAAVSAVVESVIFNNNNNTTTTTTSTKEEDDLDDYLLETLDMIKSTAEKRLQEIEAKLK